MNRRLGKSLLGALSLLIVSCLASCQAVFTWSPLAFLQRDPTEMTAEQKLSFAEQALASGDDAVVEKAYEAVAAEAAKPDNIDDPEIQYTAAQLALEVSGVSEVFDSVLGSLAGGGSVDISAATLDLIDDEAALANAGDFLVNADGAGADLSASDYLVGAIALVVSDPSTDVDAGTVDETSPDVIQAVDFITQAIAELPADDPTVDFLQSFVDAFQAGDLP